MEIYSQVSEEEIELEYKKISQNIKKIRKSKKITQEELALTMGFTTATFYTNAENIKNGKHFNLEHIIKISKILDTEMCEFFKN
ncbi:MAG: helix-turn-helix domain-containing protein [Aliarcobacter sp.]|nr:helix-turn-helix domain-containing protein [Aliarcobacter sp.]